MFSKPGPVASGLTNKFGCRSITIVGSILAGFGLLISVWAESIVTLIFTIGVCTGAGFGLIYLPAIVSVTCYFEKKRAFATGIAVCGSGIGSAIFAPLTEQLIDTFGWRGAMIIVAGLVTNCAVFGALFRPIEVPSDESDIDSEVIEGGRRNQMETETEEDEEDVTGYSTRKQFPEEMKPDVETCINFHAPVKEGTDEGHLSDRRFSEGADGGDSNVLQEQLRLQQRHEDITGGSWIDSSEGISIIVPSDVTPVPSIEPDSILSLSVPQRNILPVTGTASSRRVRKKPIISGVKSDVNLRIHVTDIDSLSVSCRGLDSAPVCGHQPDSPTRHSFCVCKANSVSRVHRKTSLVQRQVSGSTAATTASRCHHHRAPKRKTSGPSGLSGLFLGRQDIFYSRSTLNLQQQALQFKSNPILYSVSSSAVSRDFKKAYFKEDTERMEEKATVDKQVSEDEPTPSTVRIKPKKTVSIDVEEKKDIKPINVVEKNETQEEEEHFSSSSTLSEKYENEEESKSCCPKEIVSTFKLMMDFKILSNPIFLLFAASNFITSLGYYVPHIYLKDMVMTSLGPEAVTESQASNLIGFIGIGSTVGRLVFGFLSDHSWINRLTLYNSCLTICGFSIILTTVSTTYFSVAFCSIIFGLFCGEFSCWFST